MKKIGLIVVLFWSITPWIWAQTDMIPKVAVVDINAVYQAVSANTDAVKKIESMRDNFNKEIKKQQEIIDKMKDQLVEAEENGDKIAIRDLTRRIRVKENDLATYRQSAANQLKNATDSLKVDPETLKLIQRAIENVANRRGYSIVFSSSGSGLVYWSPKVDITREVSAEVATLQKAVVK
ncbi:OmpH family outer membrane protein [Entomospira nematocerorum]|uniref:OmpH family outer membrane protein n=1 Tax=Entomospira nematocerorum TaxID=2719987 RepID=A0A968KSB3_9SPIO|nr:OmpH family outer membrane protein [Entomospira nematocera]NIZ46365.1 OmpH family outer membrane protein [Entomospira nematocera]WDI33830.1 OmpH family outer membrane protein [Entomospira nematocera]